MADLLAQPMSLAAAGIARPIRLEVATCVDEGGQAVRPACHASQPLAAL